MCATERAHIRAYIVVASLAEIGIGVKGCAAIGTRAHAKQCAAGSAIACFRLVHCAALGAKTPLGGICKGLLLIDSLLLFRALHLASVELLHSRSLSYFVSHRSLFSLF